VDEPTPRFWELFFAVYEALPRQGPGNRACAAAALGLCGELPAAPAVLDLGCGVGGQTLDLAELTAGSIVALDRHAPAVARLARTVVERGLLGRVRPLLADMGRPPFAPASFDLVWSEGALYNLGIERALEVCHRLLRPGGRLAFTDAVWRVADPPPEVRAAFAVDYPTMGRATDVLAAAERAGFALLGHFTLPDECWWDTFYTPMERRIAALRESAGQDAEALAILDRLAAEPELHRAHSHAYAYEFFVACRGAAGPRVS